jgi:hypothetical protein
MPQAASPVRPSTFHESVSERTVEPVSDFPSGEDSDYTLDEPEDYGFPDRTDMPVGVYVTAPIPSDRPLREWSAGTLTVEVGAISQIVGGDRGRSRLVVRNLDDAEPVFLTRDHSDQPMLGYQLAPGTDVELFHNSPVWVSVGSAPAQITYIVERMVEELDD